MKLYPAIDLRGGQAVRLYQGDYDRMTVYNADPVAQAQQFIDAGAKYLHVVDLDGAKDDTTANLQTIAAMAELAELSAMHCHAAILGKSIYTGAIDLAEAVRLYESK